MIDIHSHILPGIDDGSKNMKDSIKMAWMSYQSGVKALIVTPHCNIDNIFENYYDERLKELFLEFQDEIRKENIPIETYLGMEVYATEEVPALLCKGKLVTLNCSRYILIEFDFREDSLLADFIISEATYLGYVPIIAHPERYPYIQKRPDIVLRWMEQGCLMQINKGSILGNFGVKARDTALYLLEHRMVTFVASDAHSPLQRTTDLSKVYEFIKANYSEAYAKELLHDNPRRVIDNKDIINAFQQMELQNTIISYYRTKRG